LLEVLDIFRVHDKKNVTKMMIIVPMMIHYIINIH